MSTVNPLDAHYELLTQPNVINIDHALLLELRVTNTGSEEWPNYGTHPVNLAYHWRAADGTMLDLNGQRTHFPHFIQPNETIEIEMVIEPPDTPGDYQLEIDMVAEGRAWFASLNVPTITMPISFPDTSTYAPRICVICSACPINDAVGNHVANQIEYFAQQGYDVLGIFQGIDRRRPAQQRQYMVELSLEQLEKGKTPAARRALRFFRQSDRFVYHYPIYYELAETMSWVEQGIVVLDYHGVTPPHLWDGPGIEMLYEGQRRLSLAHYADYAIAHSSYAREELLASGAIDRERVFVLPYIVPLQGFQPSERDPEIVAKYGLEDKPVLLYVGRMAANKRIIDLVRALPLIQAQHPGTKLLMVGDKTTPPYNVLVRNAQLEAEKLGVGDDVIFAGPYSHDQLYRLYNSSDVYVTSSLHEGFCIPVIEAMACGLPVVGTHTTALPETIGEGGLTFTPEDPTDLAAKVNLLLSTRLAKPV